MKFISCVITLTKGSRSEMLKFPKFILKYSSNINSGVKLMNNVGNVLYQGDIKIIEV